MPNPPPNSSGLRDNHTRGTVADFLRAKTQIGSKLSIVSAYFTIYAYEALKAELERIEHLDFLFGEPSFVNRLDPSKTEKKAFIIDATGLELSNKLQQKSVAKECADWIERKVDIKTIKQSNLLHGKMYHVATAGVEDAILGSSNFTVRGLGLGAAGNNIELNLIVDGNRDRQELKQWFDELWGNETLVKDVKQEVLNYLKQLYENNTPEFIYYKTLFHIFEKFLGDAGKTDADLGKTSLFETGIWKALFEFQKDGAKGAINKILRHNGCIIADSVGLGKTYEALAVIKYFELKNERVLVLCPKKLRDNWTVYKANSLLNPFVADRFRYDVVSHTDLSRETGYSGDINLATLNWGNFDLIVVDESHNFRNNTPGKRDEDGNIVRKSRYQRLMEDIIKSGVRTKVLLLSATPVNNDLKDLRNQLYFLTENRDDAFAESIGVGSLKETLATAQKVFSIWAKKQTHERKTGELLEKLSAAFFKLLDELTIARSRKHIQKYYKATLAQLGGFPKREKPVSIYPEIDLRGRFLSYDKLNDEIVAYKLALFNPSRFVMPEHKADYEKKGAFPFTQGQRETFLIGMMKVNFLKRLESSVKSFEITMERTIAKIEGLEKKIKNFQALPKQNPESEELELEIDNPGHDDDLDDAMQVGGKLKFRLNHLRLDGDGGWHCGSWSDSGSNAGGHHSYEPRVWQHVDFTSHTACPECRKPVYFIRHNDGSVWVDELGWPWPKHACFDKPNTATHAFHDWANTIARNKNPNMGVVSCIRPSLSGESQFVEVVLGNRSKIGFFLAWMPPVHSLLGALVVISREDRLLIHAAHGEIAMHDIVDLSERPKVRRGGPLDSLDKSSPQGKSPTMSVETRETRVVCSIKAIAHAAWIAAAGAADAARFETARHEAQELINDYPADIRDEIEDRLARDQWRLLLMHRHNPKRRHN